RGPTVAGIITQRLLGWSMTYGGSVDYEPGATFALGSASVDLYAKWTTDTNVIGKVGPAGGYIFYDDAADVYPGWRYLEAAPEDLPASWPWGCKSSPTPTGATDTAIGSGPTLTAIIISQCGSANASGQCDAYTLNGYSDWFLPSLNELQQLRLNLTSPGRAAYKITEGGPYWSSTEGYWGDNYHGDYMELDDGGYVVQQWKENPELVRPVRRFE
ncbi:MAG: hypothetical protein JXA20_18085, partial [Spirochaetes bacterium]|nr:hypothetical protein [Spirochaetota bacterium]